MKVIHINAHGKFSTGNIATQLASHSGEGSKVFYTRDILDSSIGTKFYSKIGFFLDLFMTRITGLDGVWSWGNTRRIIREIKKEKPDLLHLHNLHGFYINYKMLFSFIKKEKMKVVWTLHDTWSFTGHCTHFDFIGCKKWQKGCGACPLKKQTYLKSWFFDGSRLNFKMKQKAFLGVEDLTIVTPSAWLKSLVKQSFLKDYEVKVIHNGIPTELFSITQKRPVSFDLPKDKKIVLAVASSWDEMKGFSDVVQISRKLGSEYQVVMAGVTPEQKEKLEEENIFSICKTESQEELVRLYSSAYVFINTTYQEVLGLVNLEARACGCPVVTYASGGAVETVDENSGAAVPKGSVDDLISEIYALSEKHIDRKEISKTAKEKFSKEKMVQTYLSLYVKK